MQQGSVLGSPSLRLRQFLHFAPGVGLLYLLTDSYVILVPHS